ncbi:hypothetical protein J6590_009148 [Homalodisca vitripennis]|nr:hypothetical protein J6590_009148 [Homalodisca vitripennis]
MERQWVDKWPSPSDTTSELELLTISSAPLPLHPADSHSSIIYGARVRNARDTTAIRNPVRSSHKFEDFRRRRVLYLSLGGRLNGTPTSNPDKLPLSSLRSSFSWFSVCFTRPVFCSVVFFFSGSLQIVDAISGFSSLDELYPTQLFLDSPHRSFTFRKHRH